jgi:protein-tyrosine phosphatase
MQKSPTGRIEVHAHLLPGIDDGCQTLEDAFECARRLVVRGYSHCFCTPHIWSNLPNNNVEQITRRTAELQGELDRQRIPLRLLPGGELNLRADVTSIPRQDIVTFANAGRHLLIDMWADRIPPHVEPAIRWFQSLGLTVILAHPERMRAFQTDPSLAEWFAGLGVLLQGNFQCFADPPEAPTRRAAEQFLGEGRYFMLGSDLHGVESLRVRLAGMDRVRELVDDRTYDRLTIDNPRELIPQELR